MTKNEAWDILEVVDQDMKVTDYILIEGSYDKAIAYIMDVTGCDEEIAREIAFEIFPQSMYDELEAASAARAAEAANKCIPKCPTCGSTDLKPAGILDYIFTTSHGTNTHSFVCKNCGYEW